MREATQPLGSILDATTNEPVPLAMQHLHLSGWASPVGALLRITHRFKAQGKQPIEALYTFGLPRNGVLRRFVVKGKDFEVASKLSPRTEARQEYEQGLADGHLSVLGETSLDGVVTLSVGQIRPDEEVGVVLEALGGVEVQDRGFRFRFPFTLPPRYHRKALMTATPTGGRIDLPEDVFGDLILPEWRTDTENLHAISFDMHVEPGGMLESLASPSHRVSFQVNPDGSADVTLASGDTAPNRDLVIDVKVREASALVFADRSLLGKEAGDQALPEDAPRWTAIIPSSVLPQAPDLRRKVAFVVDQSGSMDGTRLSQAKAALAACLAALGPEDWFGLLSFESQPHLFRPGMVQATDANRQMALQWLARVDATGGTELALALEAAVHLLGDPGHDIFLITDGEVSETGPIIEAMTASGARVHVLGVGEASEDRFLSSLARRTQGVSRMVGSSENVGVAGLELFNAIRQPIQAAVRATVMAGGMTQIHQIDTVYENRSIVITDNGQTGKSLPVAVVLDHGGGQTRVPVKDLYRETPDGLSALLWAGRQVEDLEAALDMSRDPAARRVVEDSLEAVSLAYGLASRVMSLCAVVKRAGDLPGVTPDQKVVPVGMPWDMRDGAGVFGPAGRSLCPTSAPMTAHFVACAAPAFLLDRAVSHRSPKTTRQGTAFTTDLAIAELGTLQADGGLPGQTIEARVLKTTVLALAVLNLCVDHGTSMFAAHLRRMADFLDAHQDVAPDVLPGLIARFRGASDIMPGRWDRQYDRLTPEVLASPDKRREVWNAIRAAT